MKLTPENDGRRHFDFPALWKKALVVSGVCGGRSLLALIIGGLDLGIDFEGGTSFEVQTDASIDEVSDVLPGDVAAEAIIQEVTTETGERLVRVRSSVEDPEAAEGLRASLDELGEITAFESVGPTWGSAITNKALRALFFFFIAIRVVHLRASRVEDGARRARRCRTRHHPQRWRVRHFPVRSDASDRDCVPDDHGLLAVRHDRRVRQGP